MKKGRTHKATVIILLVALVLLPSCIKSDGENASARLEDDNKADMSLENTTFTLYRDDSDPIVIKAEKAEFWTEDEKAEVANFSFTQKDEDGNETIRGNAGSAEIDTADSVFILKGSIFIESIRENFTLETEGTLTFDSENEEISTPGVVYVSFDSSSFSGEGFYGNLKKEEYSFGSVREGKIAL